MWAPGKKVSRKVFAAGITKEVLAAGHIASWLAGGNKVQGEGRGWPPKSGKGEVAAGWGY